LLAIGGGTDVALNGARRELFAGLPQCRQVNVQEHRVDLGSDDAGTQVSDAGHQAGSRSDVQQPIALAPSEALQYPIYELLVDPDVGVLSGERFEGLDSLSHVYPSRFTFLRTWPKPILSFIRQGWDAVLTAA
jgi:hypothetical protein